MRYISEEGQGIKMLYLTFGIAGEVLLLSPPHLLNILTVPQVKWPQNINNMSCRRNTIYIWFHSEHVIPTSR